MERRQFFSLAGIGVATVIASNFLESCSKSDSSNTDVKPQNSNIVIDLSDPTYAGLATKGGAVVKGSVLIIHLPSDEYIALSKMCTHQGCTVGFDGSSTIVCPCHGSKYNTTGAVINGPAASPLAKYQTQLNGNMLTVVMA